MMPVNKKRVVSPKLWKHAKKYKGKTYVGSYHYSRGEREFVLSRAGDRPHNVVFESYEAAKSLGWIKIA
jgi:hypothetical protein